MKFNTYIKGLNFNHANFFLATKKFINKHLSGDGEFS